MGHVCAPKNNKIVFIPLCEGFVSHHSWKTVAVTEILSLRQNLPDLIFEGGMGQILEVHKVYSRKSTNKSVQQLARYLGTNEGIERKKSLYYIGN